MCGSMISHFPRNTHVDPSFPWQSTRELLELLGSRAPCSGWFSHLDQTPSFSKLQIFFVKIKWNNTLKTELKLLVTLQLLLRNYFK